MSKCVCFTEVLPSMSTRELHAYVRQLRHTVLVWQSYAARLQGVTLAEMRIRALADLSSPVTFPLQEHHL